MAQIDIELAKLKETKASIAQSITAKGGVLTNPSDFSSYSTAVTSIPTTVTDFSVIEYDSVPEPFNSGIEYAKQIKDNWDGSAMGIGKYKDNKQLIFFPVVDTSATIPDLGETAKVTGMKGIFGASGIVRVEGMNIKVVKAGPYANYWVDDYGEVLSLRYMLLRRLGSLNNITTYNFAAFPNWGVNDTANPDAKQSLLDTLNGAPNRTGYNTCTVKLAQTTLNVLTDEEKTAFTSKNYVLAVGTMYD